MYNSCLPELLKQLNFKPNDNPGKITLVSLALLGVIAVQEQCQRDLVKRHLDSLYESETEMTISKAKLANANDKLELAQAELADMQAELADTQANLSKALQFAAFSSAPACVAEERLNDLMDDFK